jgi:hypothetical protein
MLLRLWPPLGFKNGGGSDAVHQGGSLAIDDQKPRTYKAGAEVAALGLPLRFLTWEHPP